MLNFTILKHTRDTVMYTPYEANFTALIPGKYHFSTFASVFFFPRPSAFVSKCFECHQQAPSHVRSCVGGTGCHNAPSKPASQRPRVHSIQLSTCRAGSIAVEGFFWLQRSALCRASCRGGKPWVGTADVMTSA